MVIQIEQKLPLVSVIMATMNSDNFIAEALESIMFQKYDNLEIIIIDSNSSDNTREIAAQYSQVVFYSQSGKGLFEAWNQGIKLAKGEFIAILDSDDYWAPNTILTHILALKQDSSKIGSLGHVQYFLEKNQSPPPEFKLSLLDQSHLAYMPGCFLCRRLIFDKIGLYETNWKVASDIIWFAKVKELKDELILLNNVVLYKRVHNRNISYSSVKHDIYGNELLTLLQAKIRQKNQ